ncbi:MAG: chloride channel protein [Planctomycetota bacterium]
MSGRAARGSRRRVWLSAGKMIALSAIVGLLAGLAAIVFEYIWQFSLEFGLRGLAGYSPQAPAGEPDILEHAHPAAIRPWMLLLLPTIGGGLAGWIAARFAPEVAGKGTDAAIAAYHQGGGHMRARVPLLKMLATALTLGSGGSGGREGPIAQIGAGVGALLAEKLHLGGRQRRILLAAGMGAGVAAVFRAPLAGAIFAAEILYRDAELESEVILPSFVSVTAAYCLCGAWFGSFTSLFALAEPPRFDDPRQLGAYTIMGLVIAVVILGFMPFFHGTCRALKKIRVAPALRAAAGGLAVGLIAIGLWKALDDERALNVMALGYGMLQEGFSENVVGWSGAGLFLAVALGKLLTTTLSIGSGGSGGFFGPGMVVGGCLGGAVGIACHELGIAGDPAQFELASFVLVGMCGFFAGAAKTPLSTIIIVSEITGSHELLLPAIWVCMITFTLTSSVALYSGQPRTKADSPAHRGLFRVPLLQDMTVAQVMESERSFPTVTMGAPLGDVLKLVADTHADYFPVLDGPEGRLVGIFSAHDVRSFTYDDSLHRLAVAADIMTTQIISVAPTDDLHTALERFNTKNIDELPVVDPEDPTRLIGMLRRRAITRAYQARLSPE